jgi:hypothetical protein
LNGFLPLQEDVKSASILYSVQDSGELDYIQSQLMREQGPDDPENSQREAGNEELKEGASSRSDGSPLIYQRV